MSDAGGLQLLPETRKKIEINLPGQNRSFVLAFVFLALIIGLYFGLNVYKQNLIFSINTIDAQITELERSRDKKVENSLLDLREQLAVVNPLISAHLFWSGALIKIQSVTQSQVQFKSINADVSGNKIVSVLYAANYTTVARQIASLYTIESITDVILSKVQSQSTGRLEVTLQISFDSSKFLAK
ncbi:MAG: hypothetical protein AAB784_02935 [Patescibacteria group bacterium]